MKKKRKGTAWLYLNGEKKKYLIGTDCGVCSCHSTCRAWLCADEDQAESAHGSCSRRVSSGIKDAGRIYYHCTTSEYRKRYLSGNRGESVTFKKSL